MYGLIALIDQTTDGISDNEGHATAGAIAHQIQYHAAPAHHMSAMPVVWFGRDLSRVPKGSWPIVAFNTPDQAGALGWHDTDAQGNPFGRVFKDPCDKYGVPLSSVWDHEALEAWADRYCNRYVDGGHYQYAWEIGDPVENDSYTLNGMAMSNFILPAWGSSDNPSGTKFDYMGRLKAPFSMDAGGYIIQMKDGTVAPVYGEKYPEWKKELRRTAEQPSRTVWRQVRALLS